MSTNISPNMNLPVPVVGSEPGPQWATDINNCMALIDAHSHTFGNGVQITPDGMNINSDLAMLNNNLVLARSTRFFIQNSPLSDPLDLGCAYVVGVDLYYNDVLGNQIRITQSGAVAGTPGSISSLTSPASASYSSGNQTFVWQSDASTPANMDMGSAILRNIVANSKGLTLSPPNALGSDYTLVFPTLPGSTNFVSLDASGNFGASWSVDNSTLEINSNTLQVKDGGITKPKLAALGQQISSASGTFSTSSTTTGGTAVTNLSVSITTSGRPVYLGLMADGTNGSGPSNSSQISVFIASASDVTGEIYLYRDSSILAESTIFASGLSSTLRTSVPPGSIWIIDPVGAGTYTYSVKARVASASDSIAVTNIKLIAYEL